MSLKLFAFPDGRNNRRTKILVAAKYAGVTVETPEFDMAQTETEEYRKNCNPCQRNPVLQTEDGYIFESNAILRHVARLDKNNSGLYGKTTFETSQVDMWVDFSTTELSPAAIDFLLMTLGYKEKCDKLIAKHTEEMHHVLFGLNTWLETRTFLVGERITIADLAVAFTLDWLLRTAPTAGEFFGKYKNVIRHYATVWNQPKVQEVLEAVEGPTSIAEKPKEEKKKEEPKKKEEKKEKTEEAAPAMPEKKKNPLEELPPSKFILDEFKREYSNKDTRKEAAPFFFDNYDPEGYTCFWCDYKYNEENKMQFMTANLTRGWFQRMTHMHKFAFGVALLVGEPTAHDITGFWVFRGKGLPQAVLEVDDTELFNWTEIKDVQAEREKITDFMAWDGESFATKACLEGRIFK